jgi:ATP-binding cassette subfamily F protein uup
MLPGGVDEYLQHRLVTHVHENHAESARVGSDEAPSRHESARARSGSAEERAARKTLARLDKQLARIAEREAELHTQVEAAGSDYERLAELGVLLQQVADEKEAVELEWLEAAEILE